MPRAWSGRAVLLPGLGQGLEQEKARRLGQGCFTPTYLGLVAAPLAVLPLPPPPRLANQ